jgi:hypothetical protein
LAAEVDGSHPVCAKLTEVAERLQRDFDGDAALLDSLLAELHTFIARREQEAQQSVERYIPLAQRQEQRELVAIEAARAVRALDAGGLPAAIREFLNGQWRRVLEAVGGEQGTDSSAFQDRVALARKLAWSVQPKANPAERKQLVGMLPGLLKELNEGLNLIGIPRSERAPLLDACVELHSSALRGAASSSSDGSRDGWFEAGRPAPEAPDESASEETLNFESDGSFPLSATRQETMISEVREGADTLLCVSVQPGGVSAAGLDRHVALTPGNWLQFRMPDGSRREGRLGWVGLWRGSFLVTNPGWSEAILLAPEALGRQWSRGEASVVGQASFFDKAVQRVLRAMA